MKAVVSRKEGFNTYNATKIIPMRKRTKKKKHSCPLCKPYKTKGMCRWANRDLSRLKEFEREKGLALRSNPGV
jgi:hypothetical protein